VVPSWWQTGGPITLANDTRAAGAGRAAFPAASSDSKHIVLTTGASHLASRRSHGSSAALCHITGKALPCTEYDSFNMAGYL
jgi:hypothetical protein